MSVAIKIKNLSKQYRLGLVSTRTLSHDLNRWYQMNIRGKDDPYLKIGEINNRATRGESEYVWALRDINLEVEQGEVLGIIGKNGAGKSTLLKILSKVTAPTTGIIKANGRIASLLEVGTGFHPEMTGRENIFMNGAVLGMTKAEIKSKFDEIVDFSGVERHIDTPVKRYSSGMLVRLGFAVAAHLDPEILVVDEVLAIGDIEFQAKAIGKMNTISKVMGRTILFVSHNLGSIQLLCKSGIILENGMISFKGAIRSVVGNYIKKNKDVNFDNCNVIKNSPVYVQSVIIKDDKGKINNYFFHNESINIFINLKINYIISEIYILVTILDNFKRKIFSAEKKINNKEELNLSINSNFLTRGSYSLQTIIYKPGIVQYDFIEEIGNFEIVDGGSHFSHLETFEYGCVFGSFKWID